MTGTFPSEQEWATSSSSLTYTSLNNGNGYTFSPQTVFLPGYTYTISFNVTPVIGSAVVNVSFATSTSNFKTIYAFQVGNMPQTVSFNVIFYDTVTTSLSFYVSAVTSGANFAISALTCSSTLTNSTSNSTCSNFLGFDLLSIEKLLACKMNRDLIYSIRQTTHQLLTLKQAIIKGSKNLAYELPFGNWIDVLQAYKEGNACDFNFRDFDTWNWLFNYQLSSTLLSVSGEPLTRK